MRIVEKKERKQRGCKYCLDYAGAKRCPYEKCPYIELDKYEDYEEYFAAVVGDLRQLFKDILNWMKGDKNEKIKKDCILDRGQPKAELVKILLFSL